MLSSPGKQWHGSRPPPAPHPTPHQAPPPHLQVLAGGIKAQHGQQAHANMAPLPTALQAVQQAAQRGGGLRHHKVAVQRQHHQVAAAGCQRGRLACRGSGRGNTWWVDGWVGGIAEKGSGQGVRWLASASGARPSRACLGRLSIAHRLQCSLTLPKQPASPPRPSSDTSRLCRMARSSLLTPLTCARRRG